jgi:large subunit ribosomal protein L47
LKPTHSLQRAPCTFIHTTNAKFDLKDFFDDPKNWGVEEVKTGRSWTVDELRNKSNVDLQKLWWVMIHF